MTSETQKSGTTGLSGVVFVGCLILGLAIGLLTGAMAASVIGGLGVGFIGMGVMRAITGSW